MMRIRSKQGRPTGNAVQGGTGVPPVGSGMWHSPGGPGVWCPRTLFSALILSLALLAGGTAPARAGEPCHYTWVEIQNPPGWFAFPEAINNRGHVAGYLYNGGNFYRAYVWSPEAGTVQIPMPPGYQGIAAYDINDHGVVVGQLTKSNRRPGFIWDGLQVREIPMPAWANVCVPYAINNRGQVVGMVNNFVTGPTLAFVYEDGVFTVMGDEIGQALEAVKISEQGEIVGNATFSGGYTHACRFMDGKAEFLPESDDSAWSDVGGSNNNGMAVGWVATENLQYDGAVWEPEQTQFVISNGDFEQLKFVAVNDAGRAIGVGRRDILDVGRGVVWQAGSLHDLNDLIEPAAQLISTVDINNPGQIIALIRISVPPARAIVLIPVWLPGDLTGDCRVTIDDLVLILSNFGSPVGTFPRGDVDMDGDVDLPDLAILLANWSN